MNKKKHYSREFKAQMIKEVQDIGDLSIVAQKHQVSRISLYRWINGRLKTTCSDRTTTSEIISLKKKLADADLEVRVLKELLKKTNQAWLKD